MRRVDEELKAAYFQYAKNIIEERSIPDYRDGLKPVQRRILYSMWISGNKRNEKHRKCAKIIGLVLGEFHPHSDTAVYVSLVRMAQNFAMRVPLIDGQGNFGSIDGDSAAAMRYTESRLDWYAHDILKDFNRETVDMRPNYDGTTQEPIFLPTLLPNILINGVHGIAVGIVSMITPHNPREVLNAVLHLLHNPDATLDDVMQFIKGPDYATGGVVSSPENIKQMYETGEGSCTLRGTYFFEEDAIIFDQIPYQTQKSDILQKISEAVSNGYIEGISQIRDESDRHGIRIYLKVKRGFMREIIINQIYKYTNLKTTSKFCFFALNDRGEPQLFSLMNFLRSFIDFREKFLIKKKLYELEKHTRRMHILIGLLVAVENMNLILEGVRASENSQAAKQFLKKQKWSCSYINEYLKTLGLRVNNTYELSEDQAKGILELKLNNLVKVERGKTEDELIELRRKVEQINNILNSKEERIKILSLECQELIDKYKTPRRTIIEESIAKYDQIDLVPPEDIMIILSSDQYIKHITLSNYRQQNRGGKGRTGSHSNADVMTNIIGHTRALVLFFSNFGKVYSLYGYQIPKGDHTTKGRALINILNLDAKESIIDFSVVFENELKEFTKFNLIFITKNGYVRRNKLDLFINLRSDGKKYMSKDECKGLVDVLLCADTDYLFMATKNGIANCSPVSNYRVFASRESKGVRGCKLKLTDKIIGALISNLSDKILSVSEKGFGKISSIEDYRITKRGSSGVINMKCSDKTGSVVSVVKVNNDMQVIAMTKKGQVIRFSVKSIRTTSRNTIGVKIFNTPKGDLVFSAKAVKEDEQCFEDIQ